MLRRRLEQRERDFLALVRDAVYANPISPHRALLAHAGCEYGDLERLVNRDGLEASLQGLYHAGVYLTVSEFKGRCPVERGSTTFQVEPRNLRNAIGTRHLTVWTGGSRGVRTPIAFDLRFVRDVAVNRALTLASRGRAGWRLAFWDVGDEAVVKERRCGCALDELGWRVHLHSIRSYEKLTAGGMTFLDKDIIPVLEDWLPARFGGGPTDYQLVEDSSAEGEAMVPLLVHPAVGPLDPAVVAKAFLTRIGAGPGATRVMGLVWQDAQLLRVERCPPIMTSSGKILHLHVEARTRGRE